LKIQEMLKELEVKLQGLEAEILSEQKRLEATLADQQTLGQIHSSELTRQQASDRMELEKAQAHLQQRLLLMQAEVAAVVHTPEPTVTAFIRPWHVCQYTEPPEDW